MAAAAETSKSYVKPEYAPELAVLSTWLLTIMPWSATRLPVQLGESSGTVLYLRFLFLRFQSITGISFPGTEKTILWVYEAPEFNQTLGTASWVWAVGAGVSVLALGVSLAYYHDEQFLTARSPVDPVRLLGGLQVLIGVVMAIATVLFWQKQPQTVPIGPLFALLFGAVLLTIERPEDGQPRGSDATSESRTEPPSESIDVDR